MASQPRIVTQDIRDIPSHCVPLASFGGRRNKRGGSWEYETLHTLCKRREIKHWKFERGRTGQLFVEPETAKQMLDSLRHQRVGVVAAMPATKDINKLHAESVCESLSSIHTTLDEIYRVLERLTAAVELFATQPKTPQQELASTFESNGFHQ